MLRDQEKAAATQRRGLQSIPISIPIETAPSVVITLVELRRLKDSERRAAKAEQKLSISVIKDLLIVAFSLSVSELVRSQSIEAKEILGILSAVILVALVLTLVRTYR